MDLHAGIGNCKGTNKAIQYIKNMAYGGMNVKHDMYVTIMLCDSLILTNA